MKLKKVWITLTVILILAVLGLSTYSNVYADTEDKLYLGLVLFRKSGYGYATKSKMIDGTDDTAAVNVWKLISYSADKKNSAPGERNENPEDFDKFIYCLNKGKGFVVAGENDIDRTDNEHVGTYRSTKVVEYSEKLDMFKDKTEILGKLAGDSNYSVIQENYNKLLWVFDNMYVPIAENSTANEDQKNKLLTNVFYHDDMYNKDVYLKVNSLTDEEIDVIQQLAIWHFTNGVDYDSNLYVGTKDDVESPNLDEHKFTNIEDVVLEVDGIRKDLATKALYDYLVANAETKSDYKHEENKNSDYITTATFWADENNENQPVVIVEKTPKPQPVQEFDLSLRKRITEIKKADGTILDLTRAGIESVIRTKREKDNITYERLNDLTDDSETEYTTTTATYVHRKDPITVDTGDLITYTITIYNEGDIAGRATMIKDQLPAGLEFDKIATENLKENNILINAGYKFECGADNLLKISEEEGSTHENLAPYKNNTLASRSIKIVCRVKAEKGEKEQILTNIAWIAADNAPTGVVDRDSVPNENQATKTSNELNSNNIGYTGKEEYTTEEGLRNDKYYLGEEDDDDFEKIKLPSKEKIFDLALRKYITKVVSVDGTEKNIEESEATRNPNINKNWLKTGTTAEYKHRKDPVVVKEGDLVTYNITVYNEGEKSGRATKIVDQLPTGLEFDKTATENLKENNILINAGYKFECDENNTLTITEETEQNNLVAYEEGKDLASKTIKVVAKVTQKPTEKEIILTNIAYIAEAYNKDDKKTITNQEYRLYNWADRDSEPDTHPTKTAEELNTNTIGYTGKTSYTTKQALADSTKYYEGFQDDDDFEKVVLLPDQIDLALRKFITEVQSKETIKTISTRIPQVDTSTIATTGTATYNHTKEPVSVAIGDIVTYTIRVYNEGGLDAYASEITDHLPDYLQYISATNAKTDAEKQAAEFNANYLWETTDGKTIKTQILSLKQDKSEYAYSTLTGIERKSTLLKAYDGGKNLDYIDVKVKCKVLKVEKETKITNIADITRMQNKLGEEVETDRDSTVDNVNLPKTDKQLQEYKDNEIGKKDYIPGQEDDDDFEKLIVQIFDLALRKFITAVDDEAVTTRYPVPSYDKEADKIKYTHPKDPVGVSTGNLVTYTIRIFNEGEVDGYAKEVTDNLPEGLLYVPDNKINEKYRWKMIDKDGKETTKVAEAKYITTDYLSKAQETETGRSNLLKAFDKEKGITDTNPDYRDLKVVFEVIEPNTSDRILINTAQISDDEDKDGNEIDDIDSIPNNDEEYNFDDETKNEDDIDIEKVKLKYFDLALRKFITAVDKTSINNRIPSLSLDEKGKIKYTHTKVPVEVENGNIVTYTIRVFNEGNMNGFADEVTDDMPEGLEFLPNDAINKEYRWKMIDKDGKETQDVTKAVKITTDYLSKAQQDETGRNNLIKAFDKEIGLTKTNPDYRDVKVAFKVTEPNTSDRILVNTAEISDDSDEKGKPVDDIDSTPGNNKEGEDDIDKEYVKVKYFDLALKKWVTQAIVIQNGEKTVTETGHTGDENPEPPVKVDLKEKALNSVTVKFAYKIKVINEGEIAGYAKEVKDHIPEGLKFVKEDNPDWYECEDGTVATAKLENTLLKPGETATVDIVLTWINNSENMGLKTNYAEISKDYNDSNTPDIDSKPNNFKGKPVEDDEDEAPVVLSIQTGTMPMYIALTITVLTLLTGGIALIKKYVL